MAQPNGTSKKPISTVVGINFGNSYASIAVLSNEGLAECIANEDGERQIASAISFHGEQIYVGNQAKHQLLKNSKNTIVGFRNALGKKFSELVPSDRATTSAPLIQHPTIPDTPAYSVETAEGTRTLTVPEATTLFLRSLLQSAQDYLGKPITTAVITHPPAFTASQKSALHDAAQDAGVPSLYLHSEAAAVAVSSTAITLAGVGVAGLTDRTQLQIDLGSSSLSLSLLHLRAGLPVLLAQSTHSDISTNAIDTLLIQFFAADFTKKTKTKLDLPDGDRRAQTLFELALPLTKRTLGASASPASISIESIKDGLDYNGSVNRMRFGMIASKVYGDVATAISELLAKTQVDASDIDEVSYVGGGGCLPGLEDYLVGRGGLAFKESVIGQQAKQVVDPTEVLSRGCAIQAGVMEAIPAGEDGDDMRKAFISEELDVKVVSKTIGVVVPGEVEGDLGGTFIPAIVKGTPIPARRIVSYEVALSPSGDFAAEIWEVEEGLRIEKVKLPKPEYSDGEEEEDEDEEDEEEIRHKTITKTAFLGNVQLKAELGLEKEKEKVKRTTVQVEVIIGKAGQLEVTVSEVGQGGAKGVISVPAS